MTEPAPAASFRVGLTGGIASGKSTVARRWKENGFEVVDADRLVSKLYRPGEPGALAVRDLFGDEVFDEEGAIDHAKLAARVFADDLARHRLEAAIHPLVRQAFLRIAESTSGIVVLEATLLVEAGMAEDFNYIVTLEAPREVRLARAVARGLDEASVRARLRAQGSGATRRGTADRILDSSGTLAELHDAADALAEEIRMMARHPDRRA